MQEIMRHLDQIMSYLDIILRVGNFLILSAGLIFAFYRFGLKRERFSFLNLTLDAKVISSLKELKLVCIIVRLENKGDKMIEVRRERGKKNFLLKDDWDSCMHAGTLKIRPIPTEGEPLCFDWYYLKPMKAKKVKKDKEAIFTSEEDLEQINYLCEFEVFNEKSKIECVE